MPEIMTELQERMKVLASRWIARAEELELEASTLPLDSDSAKSKRVTAKGYRLTARELAKEAGFNL